MQTNEVECLKIQLYTARNEINNLRQQVRSLQHVQRKDIESLKRVLSDFRCEGCRLHNQNVEAAENSNSNVPEFCFKNTGTSVELFKPIGIIRTLFPEKRAVPRQSSVGGNLRGVVELNDKIFTNPAHALDGLQEYSHLWLIYHFHKNTSHPKAKIAPPRLGGERVGVFSTRAPHRPCPIGLSLVEINKIEGSNITFFGTDMIDGTPVLDIKPYIPFYDVPLLHKDVVGISGGAVVESVGDFYNTRQEPDGEESDLELLGATGPHILSSPPSTTQGVKFPNWVVAEHSLKVLFNERSEDQLQELQVERKFITNILEADPRSIYLRTKYGSQIFTFQFGEVTVTCKFDDKASRVTVLQVRRTENVQSSDISVSNATSPDGQYMPEA